MTFERITGMLTDIQTRLNRLAYGVKDVSYDVVKLTQTHADIKYRYFSNRSKQYFDVHLIVDDDTNNEEIDIKWVGIMELSSYTSPIEKVCLRSYLANSKGLLCHIKEADDPEVPSISYIRAERSPSIDYSSKIIRNDVLDEIIYLFIKLCSVLDEGEYEMWKKINAAPEYDEALSRGIFG